MNKYPQLHDGTVNYTPTNYNSTEEQESLAFFVFSAWHALLH